MFTIAQPAYHLYNPYEELAMQQELQRRRQLEAYLRRQREAEEIERRRRYEAAVRAEYERRREAELERQRQAELQRRRQAQQARERHSMYDGGLESLFDALYRGQSPRQGWSWGNRQDETQSSTPTRKSPSPARNPTPTPVPVSTTSPEPTPAAEEPEPEEPQIDTAPSYSTVQSVLSSFTTLQSEFSLPTQLDFLPGSSKLAYTPNNAPLHGYEHSLTGLLTQLDAVESYGDDGVRKARKEAVKAIEKELERLDGMKVEAWGRFSQPQPEAEVVAVEVNPLDVPLPQDEDEEMEEVKPASEAAVDQSSAPTEPTTTDQVEATALPDVESTLLERPLDTHPTPVPASLTPSNDLTLPDDSTLRTPSPNAPEPLTLSPISTLSSEASGADCLELLGEYKDVGRTSDSKGGNTKLEQVEKDGDLELMSDWDLCF